jgi:hypothetical protein
MTLADLATLPEHVRQLQDMVNRCASAADKKALIVQAGAARAITPDEAHLLITANMLECE